MHMVQVFRYLLPRDRTGLHHQSSTAGQRNMIQEHPQLKDGWQEVRCDNYCKALEAEVSREHIAPRYS